MQKQKQLDKQKKENQAVEKLNEFLKLHSIKLSPGLTFPNYNKLPMELELALTIVKKHEPSFEIEIVVDEPEESKSLK